MKYLVPSGRYAVIALLFCPNGKARHGPCVISLERNYALLGRTKPLFGRHRGHPGALSSYQFFKNPFSSIQLRNNSLACVYEGKSALGLVCKDLGVRVVLHNTTLREENQYTQNSGLPCFVCTSLCSDWSLRDDAHERIRSVSLRYLTKCESLYMKLVAGS